jgi:hypothetical protein
MVIPSTESLCAKQNAATVTNDSMLRLKNPVVPRRAWTHKSQDHTSTVVRIDRDSFRTSLVSLKVSLSS